MLRIFIILFLLFISSTLSSRLKYRASVKENVDLYYTITSLDKMLSVNYHQSIEFLNLNSPYTTYFLVDGQKLRTSRLIDREEFCRIKLCENSLCHPCEIEMDFVLKENGQPRDIISLILTVEDVNEYRPQFLDVSSNGQAIQLNISEGVPVGHVLPIPSATDKDGEDDELVYWLEKTTKIPFELVSFGSNQIALNVTEPLDRETRDFYELKLTASDRGNLTSTIPIHISISDINDNVPSFDQQHYTINISENTLPSLTKSLLRIHAIDNDSNENGHVTYNFSPQVSELIRQTFQLNSETGDLYLLKSLDYEQVKEYRIQVTAQDLGPVSVPVYTVIIINVEDENDNIPIMNIRVSEYFHLINNTLYISEETPINTLLMHIIVQDFDSNLNGKANCWIEPLEPKLNLTNTINNMFAIYTEQLFDREQKSNYSIQIIIEDSGLKNRHRIVRKLELIITDINDSPPIFSQFYYNISIEEEKDYQESIIKIQANDADLNENSEISYELITIDEDKNLFYINEKTGELYLNQKLDREIKSLYNLTIRAHDHGKHPSQLSTDVFLYIYILDKNEYKPEFQQKKYVFSNINENIPINSSIGFVKAIDHDDNLINYSIISSDFMINSLTGEIFVRKQLDYDTNPCINSLIIAKDSGGLNSTCQLEVCLKPINEYYPELLPESRRIHINIDNTSIIHLNATDRDRSPSNFLSFKYGQVSKCNSTFLHLSSNGTIYLNKNEQCTGIIDLIVLINDNDQYPSPKQTNQTIRFILYSNSQSLQQVLFQSSFSKFSYNPFQTMTIEMTILFIIIVILLFILFIVCLTACITYRKRKLSKRLTKKNNLLVKQSPSPLMNSSQKRLTLLTSSSRTSKDRICYTENHCLLSDGSLANDISTNSPYTKLQQSIKTNGNSDTSSSYNDSCYGSSEMDVCHHHQSTGNKLVKQDIPITTSTTETTGKILLSSNENYIILCKDSSASSDETNPSTPISSSSSSPTANNNNLITTCQPNKRPGTSQQYRTQLKSTVNQSNNKVDFFQNDDEYRKVLNSTTSFNCRNITPLNEYYL